MQSDPATGPEIVQALALTETGVTQFFASLSAAEFVRRDGDAWTPAEHLEHLCTAVSAVARGLGMRPWQLRLRFGRAQAPSRSYTQLRDIYRGLLADGAGATGAFVPMREELAEGDIADRRAAILARWSRVNERLRAAAEQWSERDLERVRLPHPVLGDLTAREMLFFTVYHNQHHIESVKRRLGHLQAPASS